MATVKRTDPRFGMQTVYNADGTAAFEGMWDPKLILDTISPTSTFWDGKRVIDNGSNTMGLPVELARRGAAVVACEPQQKYHDKTAAIIERLCRDEGLDITLKHADLFQSHTHGPVDVLLCLGLLYHFRSPLYVLAYLSQVETQQLIISTQTHKGDDLKMVNRRSPSLGRIPKKDDGRVLTGWHPTRPMMERLLNLCGFVDVREFPQPDQPKPDRPAPGLTNSAYYIARRDRPVDSRDIFEEFCPR